MWPVYSEDLQASPGTRSRQVGISNEVSTAQNHSKASFTNGLNRL